MKAASSLMAITDRPDIVFTHGQGSWLTDSTGRRHLDFVQGWAVNCLGHCPPALVAALAEQAARLINPSPAFYNQPAMDLADLLTAHSSLDRVFFANTGAEANEGAIKLARKWGALRKNGAYEIITMENGFHGRTLATMSASGKAAWKGLFEPRVPGFPKVPINDLAAVRRAANPNTVAVLLEPIQGEAGVIPAEDDFLRDLRAFTRDNDLLLMVDEVQTGMGRTGLLFGHQHAGVDPDVMTLGKGIGGGAPLAALLAREEVCCFAPGDQGGTYNGNPLMTAAGLAVMKEILAPGFLDAVAEKGRALTAALDRLSTRLGLGAVRGRGLLLALDLGRDIADRVVTEARNRGLLVNAPRPATLRFMPALNVSAEEIAAMLDILEQSLKTVLAGDANA